MSTAFKGTVEFAYIEYDAVRRFNEPFWLMDETEFW